MSDGRGGVGAEEKGGGERRGLCLTNESGRRWNSRRMSHRADMHAHVHGLVFLESPFVLLQPEKKKWRQRAQWEC